MSIDAHELIEACSHRTSTDHIGTDCREFGQVGATLVHDTPKIEISHYTLSIVREGELTLYRGRGNGLAPNPLGWRREKKIRHVGPSSSLNANMRCGVSSTPIGRQSRLCSRLMAIG